MSTLLISDQVNETIEQDQFSGSLGEEIQTHTWNQFFDKNIQEDVLILDMELEKYTSRIQGLRGPKPILQIAEHRAEFWNLFEELEDIVITQLASGGTVVIMLAESQSMEDVFEKEVGPWYTDQTNYKPDQISSLGWLYNLLPIELSLQDDGSAFKITSDINAIERFVSLVNAHYSIEIDNAVEKHVDTLAKRQEDGKSIAIATQHYIDENGEINSGDGSIVLLPQPRYSNAQSSYFAKTLSEIGHSFVGGYRLSEDSIYSDINNKINLSSIELVENICKEFHSSALRLRNRRKDKEPFQIDDEYDVQDLLHALLTVHFDQIKREEPTPSYAGRYSKIDFLLKKEGIGIETKYAENESDEGKIGDELSIDKSRYPVHPDCDILICLIYDQNQVISEPRSLENDLTGETEDFPMKTFVIPQ
jgi:hypothetical protein